MYIKMPKIIFIAYKNSNLREMCSPDPFVTYSVSLSFLLLFLILILYILQ